MKVEITTNNVPRLLLYGYQLTPKEREDFDYIEEDDFASHSFVRYKGTLYDIDEFSRAENLPAPLNQWDGYISDSFFSGVLVRFVNDGDDRVIMGTYIC